MTTATNTIHVQERPATDAEVDRIGRIANGTCGIYAFVLFCCAGPVWIFGRVFGWVHDSLKLGIVAQPKLVGWSFGGMIVAAIIAKFVRAASGVRSVSQRQVVEEITVCCDVAWSFDGPGIWHPNLVFNGGNTVLHISGQWLLDGQTYGSKDDGGTFERFFNGLESPMSFPSSKFKLVREPSTGSVLSIVPEGNYIAPVERAEVTTWDGSPIESKLYKCTFENFVQTNTRSGSD